MDDNGHGTHVAGIVAAGINDGIGIAGIAGRSKLMPVKVLNAKNQGYWQQRGERHHLGSGSRCTGDQPEHQWIDKCPVDARYAVAYALAHDVLLVVAAMKIPAARRDPASYEDVLSVAGWTASGSRWPLSNYSVNVELTAPGASIYSSFWITPSTSSYQSLSGTSMAAPHVTGLAVLMLSRNPNLKPIDLRKLLQDTALDVGVPGVDETNGYGRIDALVALAAVTPTALLTPTTSMTVTLVDDVSAESACRAGRHRALHHSCGKQRCTGVAKRAGAERHPRPDQLHHLQHAVERYCGQRQQSTQPPRRRCRSMRAG